MVIAEPFFSYAVHDAVALAGRAELLIELIRRWEEFLVDGYDTFGECWGWGTPVHGWSSTPTWIWSGTCSASLRQSRDIAGSRGAATRPTARGGRPYRRRTG